MPKCSVQKTFHDLNKNETKSGVLLQPFSEITLTPFDLQNFKESQIAKSWKREEKIEIVKENLSGKTTVEVVSFEKFFFCIRFKRKRELEIFSDYENHI